MVEEGEEFYERSCDITTERTAKEAENKLFSSITGLSKLGTISGDSGPKVMSDMVTKSDKLRIGETDSTKAEKLFKNEVIVQRKKSPSPEHVLSSKPETKAIRRLQIHKYMLIDDLAKLLGETPEDLSILNGMLFSKVGNLVD